MLHSPLYRSIRLVLFGTIGLSSVVATADSELPLPNPSSSLTHDASAYRTETVATTTTDRQRLDRDHDTRASSSAPDIDSVYQSATLDNAVPDTLTKHMPSTDADLASVTELTTITERPLNTSAATVSAKPSINIEDASIQQSLQRLAEFYVTTDNQNSDTTISDDIAPHGVIGSDPASTSTALASAAGTVPVPEVGKDLHLLPEAIRPSDIDSSQRCEGYWVYPQGDSNSDDSNLYNGHSYNNDPDHRRLPTGTTTVEKAAAIRAQADYGYYDSEDYAELSGNVVIDQGPQHIEADRVVLDLSTNTAGVQGNVLFTDQALAAQSTSIQPATSARSYNSSLTDTSDSPAGTAVARGGLIGVADTLAYNTQTSQATAHDVAFASVPLQAHGYAKKLNRPTSTQYELDQVMFTTCPPTDRKWQIEAASIDLDTDTGRGEAYNTTFSVANVPIFYLPYFNFPIDSRRSSGFLLPSASISSDSGLELDIPYYLNLSPNYDATINTHVYTNRNPMLTGEFRYLTANFGEGVLTGSYLPNDQEFDDEDRKSLFYDHYWASPTIDRLSADATYSYVSDEDYLDDFDTLGLAYSTLNLPRRARVTYYDDNLSGELKVETYQTLDAFDSLGEPLQDKDKPYSRLPQLSLNYRLPWVERLDVSGVHDSAYFKKSIDDGSEDEKSGVRVYNKLSAAYPMQKPWGYVVPKVSLQHLYTSYDEDSLTDNNLDEDEGRQSVFVPQASLDAGLNFYQAGSPFGALDQSMGGYQLLSPRLKYTYSPFKDQNDIPNFNTRIASINYNQLFSDSWFLGHDRLQDLHAITPGINYRYIDATGKTRFDGSIAEQFYIDEGRVTLDDDNALFDASSSGLVWNTSTQPYNNLWLDISGALKNNYDLNYFTTEVRYQPSSNSLFNLGYVNRQRDNNTNQLPLSAITASAIVPMNDQWRVLAQGQFDDKRGKVLDALIGIDYEDCCLGFALYGRRYYNDLNISDSPTQAVMAEVRLNGLGGDNSRLTRLLSNKILGFEPVQRAWTQ